MQSLKPKPYFPIKIQTQTCNSSLHLHIHTDRTSLFQPIKQTKKENNYNGENLCSCSAIVKTENRPLQQQTIQKQSRLYSLTTENLEGRHFSPFLVFYSITVSRVFKDIRVQQKVGIFFFHSISVSKIMFEIMRLYHMAD